MVVLKKTKSDWRIFWVVELVGMSFTLALAGIKWAGDPQATMVKTTFENTPESNGQVDDSDHSLKFRAVFGWRFLLFHSPVAVTSLSIVVRATTQQLVALLENGNSSNTFKTIINAMKSLCTAYTGLIAALVLLEIGPFMAAVIFASSDDLMDCGTLKVIQCVKDAGAVIIGCICTFNGRLPAASSVMSAGRLCRRVYMVAFIGLLVLQLILIFDFLLFGRWNYSTTALLVRCLSPIVLGFWCHRNWNVYPESTRIAPKQRPRWQILFVLVWLLFQCFFWSPQELLGYWDEEWTLRFLAASLYLAVGISVALECVGHPRCFQSPGPSARICSLLLAWSIYRLTSWDVLRFLDAIYFGENSGRDVDIDFHTRGATVQIMLLCLGINAEARALGKESVQFCLMVMFLFHVVVVWFYTVVSDLRLGTIK